MWPPSQRLRVFLASAGLFYTYSRLATRHLSGECSKDPALVADEYSTSLCSRLPLDEYMNLWTGGLVVRHPPSLAHLDRDASTNSTVALLFLLSNRLATEAVWTEWLFSAGAAELTRVYFHFADHAAGAAARDNQSLRPLRNFSSTVVETLPTSHGNVMAAANALLRAAVADASNSRFVLVSERCIPVKPASVTLPWILTQHHSWFALGRTAVALTDGPRRAVFQSLGVPPAAVAKSDLWILLNRRSAQLLVDSAGFLDALLRVNRELVSMLDEYYYVTKLLTAEIVRRHVVAVAHSSVAATDVMAFARMDESDAVASLVPCMCGDAREKSNALCSRCSACARFPHTLCGVLRSVFRNNSSGGRDHFILAEEVRFSNYAPESLEHTSTLRVRTRGSTYSDWDWQGADANKAEGRPFLFKHVTLSLLLELSQTGPFPLFARKFEDGTVVTFDEDALTTMLSGLPMGLGSGFVSGGGIASFEPMISRLRALCHGTRSGLISGAAQAAVSASLSSSESDSSGGNSSRIELSGSVGRNISLVDALWALGVL